MRTKNYFFISSLSFLLMISCQSQPSSTNKDNPDTKSGKAMILNTTSQTELSKLEQSLEGLDPETYRLTIRTSDSNGNLETRTLGSAPIAEIKKINTDFDVTPVKPGIGGVAASDIIIVIKNITSSSEVQNKILQQLDRNLSLVKTGEITYSINDNNLNYIKTNEYAATGQSLIVNTTSEAELNKIKKSLEGIDATSYRITIKQMDANGNVTTNTLGSAPLAEVEKLRTDFDIESLNPDRGTLAASDIVILIKNITKSSVIQDRILQQLDKDLSTVVVGNVDYSVKNDALKYNNTIDRYQTGKSLILNTTSANELQKIKESLEGIDPSTYRVTIKEYDNNGNLVTRTLGTAPLAEVERLRTNFDVQTANPPQGGLAASDVVILIKNITKSSVVQDRILQQLDKRNSKVYTKNIVFSADKSSLRVYE